MSNEIDVSDVRLLQGAGGAHRNLVLRLVLAQVAADSSSAVMFQWTPDETKLRYEVEGHWYEMAPPPPGVMGPLLRLLKNKAGLEPDVNWGEGRIVLRTEKGPMDFQLSACVDAQGRDLVMLYRVGGRGPSAKPRSGNGNGRVDMYERFTDRARKVMALANQEAQRFNHEYIGTEHILLALVKEGSGVGATVLKNCDADLKKLRLEVEKLVRSGPEVVTHGKLPQTPRAKRVIEFAIDEARSMNHRYVGTEHLLLGLLRVGDGVAAQILTNLGLRLENVRQNVLMLLGAGQAPGPMRSQGVPSLTTDVQRAMALAHREATGRKHERIGIEHILVALIRTGGAVQPMLESLHIDAKTLCEQLEPLLASDQGEPTEASQVRTAVRCAIQEAIAMDHPSVGARHLLLGVICASEGRTRQILDDCGLTSEAVRKELTNPRREIGEDEVESVLRQSLPVDMLKHMGLPVEDVAVAADELALQVYEVAGTFPKAKGHDIAAQMRRCALSVPPHLAEARRRHNRVESRWFLNIAISAMVELQYLLDFALKQGYIKEEQYATLKELSDRVESQLRDSPGPTVTGR